MSVNTDLFLIRRRLQMCAVLLLAALGFAGWTHAQEAGTRDRIYVVTHVDVLPNGAAAGTKLLQLYAADSRKDKGAVRVEVYIQISRVNHMSLVEVWQNREAFEAHEGAAHTKQFREQLQPLLGSPYDETLHTIAE
jgi:quinol monooxygenase YgiN